jgi:hypothetical protein
VIFTKLMFALWGMLWQGVPFPGSVRPIASGPTEIATDNFNRTNGALGANWDTADTHGCSQTMEIWSNSIYGDCAYGFGYWIGAGTFSANQYATSKATLISASYMVAGPAVRVNAANDTGYVAYWGGNYAANTVSISKFVYPSAQAVLVEQCGTLTVGDLITIEVSGSSTTTIVVKKNGTQLCTVDDSSSPITSGTPGMLAHYNGGSQDDWAAGNL